MNYLRNPSFELTTDPWTFWIAGPNDTNPHDPSPGARFQHPEIQVLSRTDLPHHEHGLFILDGDHTLKIAQYCGSWYGSIHQGADLHQAKYTIDVNIFGDLIKGYTSGGNKIWANDERKRDGMMRFVIAGRMGDWEPLTPGAWTAHTQTFTAQGLTQIRVDIMCPFPLRNSGVFCDNWSLTAEPRPEPEPEYIHVYTVIPRSHTLPEATQIFRKAWERIP